MLSTAIVVNVFETEMKCHIIRNARNNRLSFMALNRSCVTLTNFFLAIADIRKTMEASQEKNRNCRAGTTKPRSNCCS